MPDRDRWGRPLVIPPDGGKPVAYTRCTTYVSCLEDTYSLERWKMRQTAIGIAARPDLVASVLADQEKANVDAAVDIAMEVAQSYAKANLGTALHKFTEMHDRGEDIIAPDEIRRDIDAYATVMAQGKLAVDQIETFCVQDDLKIGGTFDRTVTRGRKRYVADLKTGDIRYGMGKIAMQLAVYANSRRYDDDGMRTNLNVDLERAIIIHLPVGTGKAFLHWVDIRAGWEAVQLARQVRAWRAMKNLSEPFEYAKVEPEPVTDLILTQISKCTTVTELRQLWASHNGRWTPTHTAAAEARKKEITQ